MFDSGKIAVHGTPLSLISQEGSSFELHIALKGECSESSKDLVPQWVEEHAPALKMSSTGSTWSIGVPRGSLKDIADLLNILESKNEFEWSLRNGTLEQVFMNLRHAKISEKEEQETIIDAVEPADMKEVKPQILPGLKANLLAMFTLFWAFFKKDRYVIMFFSILTLGILTLLLSYNPWDAYFLAFQCNGSKYFLGDNGASRCDIDSFQKVVGEHPSDVRDFFAFESLNAFASNDNGRNAKPLIPQYPFYSENDTAPNFRFWSNIPSNEAALVDIQKFMPFSWEHKSLSITPFDEFNRLQSAVVSNQTVLPARCSRPAGTTSNGFQTGMKNAKSLLKDIFPHFGLHIDNSTSKGLKYDIYTYNPRIPYPKLYASEGIEDADTKYLTTWWRRDSSGTNGF